MIFLKLFHLNFYTLQLKGFLLAEQLRNEIVGLRLMSHCGGGSFKSQMKKADKSGARIALIMGDDEIANQQITVQNSFRVE